MSAPRNEERFARRAVLDRLRSRSLAAVAAPEIDRQRLVDYDDLAAQFTTIAEAIGATVVPLKRSDDVADELRKNPSFAAARRIASGEPRAVAGNVDLEQFDDPHALATLYWVVARGAFGVAENGAIWVEGASLPHRAMLFIPQHLALIVERAAIVPHLTAAYDRIGAWEETFGVLVAGPSKTADIEQSLVLGAHGCRTLTILLIDAAD